MEQSLLLAGGRRAVLYTEQNMIYMGILARRQSGVMAIARDYGEGLCMACMDERMYFAYLDVFHQIILDGLPERKREVLMQETESCACFSQLFLDERELRLFFQRYNFQTKRFELCFLELQGERTPRVVWEGERRLIEYQISGIGRENWLVCRWGEEAVSYRLKKEGKAEAVESSETGKRRLEEQEKRYTGQIRELEEKLYQEEKQREKWKEWYEKKLTQYQEEQEKQIRWIQKQYQDLADTAKELQKVGKMWRDKYFAREKKKDGE